MIPGNDNSENLDFKGSKNPAYSSAQNQNNSQQSSGDSILKRSSMMSYNNGYSNRNHKMFDPLIKGVQVVNYNHSNENNNKENTQQNKIDIKRIEREGLVDSKELNKNSDIQGVPGGENFSKIIQVKNVNFLNDDSNTNSNSQLEQNAQIIRQASKKNIIHKRNNQAHRNINTNKVNQVNHNKMQQNQPQKVIRKYKNKQGNKQMHTKPLKVRPRNIRNKRLNQYSDDLNILVPPTQVKIPKSFNNFSHQRRNSHNFHNLKDSSNSIYHPNSSFRRRRSHGNRYKQLKLRKPTRKNYLPPSRMKKQSHIKNSVRNRVSNKKKVKKNKKKQLVYRLDSNNKEIIALKKRINILIKMNNKLLKQIQSSPLLNQEKKTLSKRIVNFIEKVKGLKKRNFKKYEKDVVKTYNLLRNRYENIQDQMFDVENNNDKEEQF
jgi:hypothetical protein